MVMSDASTTDFSSYDPGARGQIMLADSSNRWGAAPRAAAAVRDQALRICEYPSLYGDAFKAAAAAYMGVPASSVITGSGSGDVLANILRALTRPGDSITWSGPTFALMPFLASARGLQVNEIPFAPGGDIDADTLASMRSSVIYVCSPNNPTGGLASADAVRRLLDSTNAVVVVDEAYFEYCGLTFAGEVSERDNLVVVRTMSKAFGLAGIRAGYAATNATLARRIERTRAPYTVNLLAEIAATVALTDDIGWMRTTVKQGVENRERLTLELARRGFGPLASHANFVCIPSTESASIARVLLEHGIAVRGLAGLRDIGDVFRVATAPWNELQLFLAALDDWISRK